MFDGRAVRRASVLLCAMCDGRTVRWVPALLCAALGAGIVPARAATPESSAPQAPARQLPAPQFSTPQPPTDAPASRTNHSVMVKGRRIDYEAVAGTLPLNDASGQLAARMFYVAYVVKEPPSAHPRPVTFFFNGGPGSSSIWLHMGSFGPVRLPIPEPGTSLLPPYRWTANDQTLLDRTDMVFLDAIGTGFSRSLDPSNNKLFWGNDEDAASFVQAITRYIDETRRWNAPKYLFGESFGTMRAAIVADRLHSNGIDLHGIIMLSTILNFGHLAPGLDQRTIDLLPSYAASAWYHHRIPHSPVHLEDLVQAARDYARGPYAVALARGNQLSAAERAEVAARLNELTGLSTDFLERANLRIEADQFRRELLRDRRVSIGADDARFTAVEADGVADKPAYDATEAAILPGFASAFHAYIGSDLGYKPPLDYIVADEPRIMAAWDWSHHPPAAPAQTCMADVLPDLASALERNRALRVFFANGYFDLMTPFFGTEFDAAKLPLDASSTGRIQLRYYASGHMVYLSEPALRLLRDDVARFYDDGLAESGGNPAAGTVSAEELSNGAVSQARRRP